MDRCWKTPKKLKSVWRGAFAGDMASTLSSEVWELREGLNVPPVPWRRDMPLPDEVDDPRKADRDRKYMENEARIRELRQQRKVLRMKAERRVAREKEGLPRAGMNRQQLIKYEAELVMNDMTKVVDGHTTRLKEMQARMEQRRSDPLFADQDGKIEALRRKVEYENAQYELERTQKAEAEKMKQESEARRQRERHDELVAKREETARAKKAEEDKRKRRVETETEQSKSATEERLERLEREAREERERREKLELEFKRARENQAASLSVAPVAIAPAPVGLTATTIPVMDDSFDEDPPVSVQAAEPTATSHVRSPKSPAVSDDARRQSRGASPRVGSQSQGPKDLSAEFSDSADFLDESNEERERAKWNAELERRRRELEDERAAEKAKIASEVDAQVEARVREMTATVPPAADDARYEDDFESPTSPSPKVVKVVESPTSPKAAMVLNPGAGYSIARGERLRVLDRLLERVYDLRFDGEFYDANRVTGTDVIAGVFVAAEVDDGRLIGETCANVCDAVGALVRSIPPGDGEPAPAGFLDDDDDAAFMAQEGFPRHNDELSEPDALFAAQTLRDRQTEDGYNVWTALLAHFYQMAEAGAVDPRAAAEAMAEILVPPDRAGTSRASRTRKAARLAQLIRALFACYDPFAPPPPGHAPSWVRNATPRSATRSTERAAKTLRNDPATSGALFGTSASSFIKPRTGAVASAAPPSTSSYAPSYANLDDSDELEAALMAPPRESTHAPPPPPRNTFRAPPPPPIEVPPSPDESTQRKAPITPSPGRPPRSPKSQPQVQQPQVQNVNVKRTARTGPTGAAAKVGSIINKALNDDSDDSMNASGLIDQMEQERSLNASDSFDF